MGRHSRLDADGDEAVLDVDGFREGGAHSSDLMIADTQRIPVINDLLEHWFPVDPAADTAPISVPICEPHNDPSYERALDDREGRTDTVIIPPQIPTRPPVPSRPPPRAGTEEALDALRRLRTSSPSTASDSDPGTHHDASDHDPDHDADDPHDGTGADTADDAVSGLAERAAG
jgi:hypothetical protein